jgi:transcriptional regulator with XRE-family HTH domain
MLVFHAANIGILCMTVNTSFLVASKTARAAYIPRMDFTSRLKAAIAATRRSQADIAREAGISPQRLSNWITRGTVPDLADIDRLAAALNVDPMQLLRGEDSVRTALEAILARVLELDGHSPVRAGALARVTVEALQIQRGLPNGGDLELQARVAAHAAWRTQGATVRPQ